MNPTIKARIESIRRGEVPEGCKRTALGCYPLDWERLTLGSISERKGEYGLNAPACEYEEGLPKYLRITIGTRQEMDVVLVAIKEILSNADGY